MEDEKESILVIIGARGNVRFRERGRPCRTAAMGAKLSQITRTRFGSLMHQVSNQDGGARAA